MNLDEMQNVDIRNIDKDSLVNIEDVEIDMNLPQGMRIKKFVEQVGNPYIYKSNGIVVKSTFTNNGKSLDDLIEKLISLA